MDADVLSRCGVLYGSVVRRTYVRSLRLLQRGKTAIAVLCENTTRDALAVGKNGIFDGVYFST